MFETFVCEKRTKKKKVAGQTLERTLTKREKRPEKQSERTWRLSCLIEPTVGNVRFFWEWILSEDPASCIEAHPV